MIELTTLWGLLGGPGFLEVRVDSLADSSRCWLPADNRGGFVGLLSELAGRDVWAGVTPRRKRDSWPAEAHCLWAVTDSKAAVAALQAFRPVPTLILREGTSVRCVALWALLRPLGWDWVVRANKRIAHRLRTPKKYASPDFMVRVPGSAVVAGRRSPLRVRTVWHQPEALYMAREVVGRLPEAPDADAWRKA